MATVASFNVALVASTGRFVGAISRAERQWNQFARSVQRGAKQLPEAIRAATPASLTLGRYVARFGAVAAAAFSAASIWGVRLAAQFEQTRMAMATMLGSVEEADQFLKELEKRARRTPFGFQQLVEMSRQMLAWGFARQEIEQMLDPIGDFVAAMGGGSETIDRVVRALGQIRARGKLASQEMLQLTEAGIPAWELLAKSIGVSIPEAMERVSRGAISSTTAIQAIIEGLAADPRFAGAMERQARTTLGQWEQVKDGITTIIRGLGKDIIKIANLGTAMRRLNEAIGRFADLVSEKGFMNALREAFPPWLPPVIIGIAGAIAGGLVPVIVALLLPALKKLRASIAATGLALWKWMVAGAAIAVVVYLLARYWNHLGDVARAVWSAIGAAALYGASLVVRGIGLILAGIGVIIPAFRGVASSVLGLADSLKSSASGLWASAKSSVAAANQAAKSQEGITNAGDRAARTQQTLADGIEAAAEAAGNNIQSFDEVHQIQEEMASSPSTALDIEEPTMPALGGITNIASAIGEQVAQIADTAANAWTRLQQAMESVNRAVQWIKDNWPMIGPIVEGIASVLTLLLLPALIKTGVEALITGGKVLASWAMQSAGAVVHGAVIVGQFALQVAKWAWLGIEALANAGKVVLAWVMQGWQAVASVATQIAQFAIVGAKWVWLGIQAGIGAAQVVAAWVAQQVQAVISVGIQVAQFVILGAKWVWLGVLAVAEAGKVVLAWVMQKAEAIAAVAVQVAQFAILGAKWVWMGVTATANAAVMAAAWLLALGPVPLVIATVVALAALIVANWDLVKTKTIEYWGKLADWLAGVWEGIETTARNVWDGILGAIKTVINGIIKAVNWMIQALNKIRFTIPDWVPVLGGKSFGFNIEQIPLLPLAEGGIVTRPTPALIAERVPLAEGGIVTRPVTALVGEAGPEAVIPLSRDNALTDSIAQAVYQAVIDAMRTVQATTPAGGDREIVLRIDGRTLARATLPHVIAEGQRQGLQLAVRPQGV